MSISFAPKRLKRYKEIALLFLKYGNSDMVKKFGLQGALDQDEAESTKSSHPPDELANDLEAMGPTFVKLGQILSSRADLLPRPYLDALARLQDKVKPFPYEDVQSIISTELGVRLSKAFLDFDTEPLAAASLGQVHRATLRTGRAVVVKVQRPGIRAQIAEDLEIIEQVTTFFDEHTEMGHRYQFAKIFDEFQRTLISELDYTREAANLRSIGENLKEFENIYVPRPIADYSTRGVLTMEFATGKKVTKISPLERMEFDGAKLADELFEAYLKQILVDGIFHADPHPGNVFLTEDHRIALLDLGMVGRTTPEMQDNLLKVLIAISEGKGEEVVAQIIKVSVTTEYFQEAEFRRKIATLVAEQQESTLDRMDAGRILLEVGKTAGENGLYVPIELTLLGKTLLQLDQIGRGLDVKFNPNAAVRKHVTDILNRKFRKDATSGKMLSTLLEMKDFVGNLPRRLNKIMDVVGESQLEVKVRAPEVHLVLEGFQKIANRITTGLVLAALIIGAALLMQVPTQFEVFGYPGLAMLCFLFAAGGGFWLVLAIFLSDQRTRKQNRRERK